jgi:hypothetical protein
LFSLRFHFEFTSIVTPNSLRVHFDITCMDIFVFIHLCIYPFFRGHGQGLPYFALPPRFPVPGSPEVPRPAVPPRSFSMLSLTTARERKRQCKIPLCPRQRKCCWGKGAPPPCRGAPPPCRCAPPPFRGAPPPWRAHCLGFPFNISNIY